jgi:uncharacterized delta-60 repeat protein
MSASPRRAAIATVALLLLANCGSAPADSAGTPKGLSANPDGGRTALGQGTSTNEGGSCSTGPDPGFAKDGVQILQHGTTVVRGIVAQADEKIVLVGDAWSKREIGLTRLLPDGTPDPSFGAAGFTAVDLVAGTPESGAAIALGTDGRLVVAGFAMMPDVHWVVSRFNADGSLDRSFGSSGLAPSPPMSAEPSATVVLADGSIVVAGTVGAMGSILVAKYDSSGQLDSTFGSVGFATTSVATGQDAVFGIAARPDGRVIVGGYALTSIPAGDFDITSDAVLVGYTAKGELDPTFGSNGIVRFHSLDQTFLTSLVLRKDGRLLASVHAFSTSGATPNGEDSAVLLYTGSGVLDPSFGDHGVASASAVADAGFVAWGVTALSDGSVVLSGSTSKHDELLKFRGDGSLVRTFGSGGVLTSPSVSDDWGPRVQALTPEGKLIIAGYSTAASESEVTRFCL